MISKKLALLIKNIQPNDITNYCLYGLVDGKWEIISTTKPVFPKSKSKIKNES